MRKFLEELIFLGAVEDTFTAYGKKWTMKTISSDEQLKATANTGNYDNLSRISALKIEILTYALKSIDNEPLNELSETNEFLGKLPMNIINTLFDKYEDLATKQSETLKDLTNLKN